MKELEAIIFTVHENSSGSWGDGQSVTLFAVVDWMGTRAARSHKEIVLSY